MQAVHAREMQVVAHMHVQAGRQEKFTHTGSGASLCTHAEPGGLCAEGFMHMLQSMPLGPCI